MSQSPLIRFCLTYASSALAEFGVTKSVDLVPDGSNIPVTRENRLQYIYLVSHYRLTKQIKRQSEAFFEGLSDIIDPKWLRYVGTYHDSYEGRRELRLPVGCSTSKSCKFFWEVSIRPSTSKT